ncbi:hypothetical protein PCASD_25528 [Puccinia coronata f. sp. avenae]|uniref:Uncharacterized protein n=1 Tax=Puccinia coronata f. sp. avenae TaxID=200324 RepID=A0A2N5TNX9_9BASI|nr:hypothetical protein PCASD_25528 [Puccinia coronata f. sp. avenae]
MAGMCRPSIREVSPPNGWYVPAFNQGGLPAQQSICTSHQSGRTPRPMTDMHQSSTRNVSLPNGWYVLAFNQGGLPAQWPEAHGLTAGTHGLLIGPCQIRILRVSLEYPPAARQA